MAYSFPVLVKQYRDKLKKDPRVVKAIRQRENDLEHLKTRRATRRDILDPIDKYKLHVGRLRDSIAVLRSIRAAIPEEYFVPDERPELLDRLDSDLLLAAMCADRAYAILGARKSVDPRTMRSDVLCGLLENAFFLLEGKPPTQSRLDGGKVPGGTFAPFVEAVVLEGGLSRKAGSAVIQYKRNRFRSKRESVKNWKEIVKKSQSASPDDQQEARDVIEALLARAAARDGRRKSLRRKPQKKS